MTVFAHCNDCDDKHELSERTLPEEELSTVCPECGSSSYLTKAEGKQKIPRKPLEENLEEIPGVGRGIVDEIKRRKLSLYDLRAMSVDDLANIRNVGPQTAENIQNHLD